VEAFLRLQAQKSLHLFKKMARKRAKPGEEAPIEKFLGKYSNLL